MRVGGLDQGDLDVLLGVDPVEAVGDHAARGAVQLGRQLGAGGAGADDRDVELARPHRLGLGVGAQAGVDQAAVEAVGLARASPARSRAPSTPGVPKSLLRLPIASTRMS